MRLVLLTCLVLIAAIAVWVMGGNGAELPAPAAGGSSADIVATDPVQHEGSGESAVGKSDSASERVIAQLPDTAPLFEIPEDATWIELLVVDAKTEQPVPNADVLWSNHLQIAHVFTLDPEQRLKFGYPASAQLRAFGWRARTDDAGRVRVWPGAQVALVMAEKGNRRGIANFGEAANRPDAHTLKIDVHVSMQVRVTDALGEAAKDVPVRVLQHSTGERRNARPYFGVDAFTDVHGLATIDDLGFWQTWRAGENVGEPVEQWQVLLRIPMTEQPVALVDAQSPPMEPVELQLAPAGCLRVRALCSGRPLPALSRFTLAAPLAKGEPDVMFPLRQWDRWVLTDGWITWPYVPLGTSFLVQADGFSVEVDGPVSQGEVREHTIELTQDTEVLVGRVLDQHGEAIRREEISMNVKLAYTDQAGEEAKAYDFANVWTDHEGRFVWTLAIDSEQPGLRITEGHARSYRVTGEQWLARLPLLEIQAGRTDLGDVRLGPGDLIVAGRILYDRPDFSYPALLSVQKRNEAGEWRRVTGLSTSMTVKHEFAFAGFVPAGRYRLVVGEHWHMPVEPREFVLGARDVEIKVRCGHQLTAAVLMPASIRSYHMQFDLVPTKGQAPAVKRKRADAVGQENGRHEFRWAALEAGTYTLEVRSKASQAPLFSLSDVRIPMPADDHRFDELDLREHVHALEIRLTMGKRNAQPMAFVSPQSGEVWHGHHLVEGRQVVPVGPGPIDLMVAARDYVSVTHRGVEGSVAVSLQPRPVAHLVFVHGTALPKGFTLHVACESLAPPVAENRKYKAEWAEGPMLELLHHVKRVEPVADGVHDLALGSGSNRLLVFLHSKYGRRALQSVTPAQLSDGGRYQIRLSDEELAAAIAELSKD